MNTVSEWIEWAAKRFESAGLHYGHGTETSEDEAAWLVLHGIGAPVDGGFDSWGDAVEEQHAAAIKRLVEERISRRCPAAYLTGTAWFAGLEFEVGPEVLVPRSPIAELIRERFEPWVDEGAVGTILDLGTGSGCIAIACAVAFPRAAVTATDVSQSALQIAASNVRRHGLEDRVTLQHSDVFNSLGARKYDLIVTNPPYVPGSELGSLPSEYKSEPAVGLVSGKDGLDIPLRIIAGAGDFLNRQGILVCEVGESEERLQEALPEIPFLWLDFESGGSGVFLLEHEQLEGAGGAALKLLRERAGVT